MILESLDSWVDSEIPKSIFVIPVYQKGLVDRVIHNIRGNAKYPKRNVEIAIPDSRILY